MISRNQSQNSATPATPTSIRVWLVDDNKDYRSLLASFLDTEEGFECTRHFSSGEAAVAALAHETPPDVILLDIEMAGQNGLDSLQPIKVIASSTRVLMLTTFMDYDRQRWALSNGASDFLLKRFPVTEISDRIRQAVEQPADEPFQSSASRELTPRAPGTECAFDPPARGRFLRGMRALFGFGERRKPVSDSN
jgi:DNA-binding NarL/FixJ family response regulator